MVKCAKCGEKIGFFKNKYEYKDNNDNIISYCEVCHIQFSEKKAKKEREEIKDEENLAKKLKNDIVEKLKNDIIIRKFCEKHYQFSLTLKKIADAIEYRKNSDEKTRILVCVIAYRHKINPWDAVNAQKYIDFLNCLTSTDLREFMKICDYDTNSVSCYISRIYSELISNRSYDGTLLSGHLHLDFLYKDFFTFYRSGDMIELSKLVKILLERYSTLETDLLFDVMYTHTKEHLDKHVSNVCRDLQTKDIIFSHIIDTQQPFLLGTEMYWVREYIDLYINCMIKLNLILAHTSLAEFREELKKYEESNRLKQFEKKLLAESGTLNISIQDIDSMNGFEFENVLAKLFTKMGYSVEQTKLSGDQGADLIIKRINKKTVVQAKRYSGNVSNKAVQEIVASIKHYKADEGMVVTNSFFTKSAIKLADTNDVSLINRNKLSELIDKYLN
jgi:HJR/Mrr/RecB family endonuclease